ncbi:MAG: two-component sensor histidine kinase [Desulfobulbus propionicus]|nr:MAG: two-component sensor histidine kinase [Desulfobulbus propionicus]
MKKMPAKKAIANKLPLRLKLQRLLERVRKQLRLDLLPEMRVIGTGLRFWPSRLKERLDADIFLPFELVKYFAFTSIFLILVTALTLSWVISTNARNVLLERSEEYSRLFADNLNRQVFLQFVLPTVVRYGHIALSEQRQYERLDLIVQSLARGMHIDSITIFDSRENRIAYSTIVENMGKRNMGGLEYQKALAGETSTHLITSGSLFNLLPGTSEVLCTLKTYVPFRQENRLGERSGDIMGVIEVVQNLSGDLRAIIELQGRIILLSLLIMVLLLAGLTVLVIQANRLMAARAAEQLRLEEKLNEAQRLASLGKMIAAVSHEIKNPLGIVRSTAEVLGKRISRVAPGNEHLASIIVEETTRLDSIVREFLDFARPRDLKLAAAMLNEQVERLLRFMAPKFNEKDVKPVVMLAPDLPTVHMDAEQIYQVIFNIAFNGLQAMADGGQLTFATGEEQGWVWVRIEDTGKGIDEDTLEHIFTPFYTDKSRGTGLGLAIAKNIIDKHGGRIEVKSRIGEGSSFTVCLPVQS